MHPLRHLLCISIEHWIPIRWKPSKIIRNPPCEWVLLSHPKEIQFCPVTCFVQWLWSEVMYTTWKHHALKVTAFVCVCHFLKIYFVMEGRLLYSVGFCCTRMQISRSYTYITSILSVPPLPASYPSWSSECQTGLPVTQQLLTSDLFYTWWYISVDAGLSVLPILSFPAVSTSPFSMSVSPFLPYE